MKVVVIGPDRKLVMKEISKFGFQIKKNNPDVVICCGGDGTVLYAERIYSRAPKVFIRHETPQKECNRMLNKLKEGRFNIVENIKVEGIVNEDPRKRLIGLNEINVANKNPLRAIRLEVWLNDSILQKEVIGDGVLVSTPFGSPAYFYSINRKTFRKGLGIAFNNSRERLKYLIVNEKSVIKIRVLRDGGLMIADNNPKMIRLKKDDIVTIKKHKYKARMIKF